MTLGNYVLDARCCEPKSKVARIMMNLRDPSRNLEAASLGVKKPSLKAKLRGGIRNLLATGCQIIRNFPGSDSVSLTFDDGPNPLTTSSLLDRLDEYEIPATFYCIGDHATRHPDLMKRMSGSGHEVGNHTMTHPDLFGVSPWRLRAEVKTSQKRLTELCGVPIDSFRAPHGHFRWDLKFCKAFGVEYFIGWDVEPNWFEVDPTALVNFVVSNSKPGSIILLHDGLAEVDPTLSRAVGAAAIDAIPMIASGLRARGIKFKTITKQIAEFGATRCSSVAA
jgi:chitooligosaccharide deacetylase